MHSLYTQAAALTDEVIAAATKVQKHFGIGALESIYVRCLEHELQLSGHKTKREGIVKISYRGLEAASNESSSKTPTMMTHRSEPIIGISEPTASREPATDSKMSPCN